ncbi:MAG: hypothetical protein GQE15_07530 [Archangiaceae bacterium]|nr:hypothetical protein [Archangiaceae bacterium]
MALKHLLRPTPTPAAERPSGITCPKYVRGEGKRCAHFKTNGACALPDEFMCVEWLKVNGKAPPAPPERTPEPRPVEVGTPAEATAPDEVGPARGFTSDDIASFKALGVEVRLRSETYGEVWLVPAYTGQPRKELTPEHAATVLRVLEAFPGSRVISFEKHTNPERLERPPRRS